MRTIVIAVIIGYAGMVIAATIMYVHLLDDNNELTDSVMEIVNERDKRLYALQNRVLTLEKQRDMERRVTDIEKQIRTFCTGTKIEMCGKIGPTR